MLESRADPLARSVSPISVFAGGAAHRELCLLATPVGFIASLYTPILWP